MSNPKSKLMTKISRVSLGLLLFSTISAFSNVQIAELPNKQGYSVTTDNYTAAALALGSLKPF